MSCIPQRARPFADGLTIYFIGRRTANDGSKWISLFVERQISKFRGAPPQPFGSSPYPVMPHDCKHGIQVPVHRIARTTCLELVPYIPDFFKPSPNPSG
jgi:hypothetical protein